MDISSVIKMLHVAKMTYIIMKQEGNMGLIIGLCLIAYGVLGLYYVFKLYKDE